MYEISVTGTFSAAHNLRHYRGKCEKLHGHNWKVELTLSGEKLDKTGLLYDFVDLKKILREIISRLDHAYLNEIPAFRKLNPSSENIAKYICDNARRRISDARLKIHSVKVWESEKNCVVYKDSD